MTTKLSTESLARAAATHPRRTLLLWGALVIASILIAGGLLASATTVKESLTNDPDSAIALDLLEERISPTRLDEVAIFRSTELTVDDPQFKSAVVDFTDRARVLGPEIINSADGVLEIFNYYEIGEESLVSEDRRTTLVPLTLAGDFQEANDNVSVVLELAEEISANAGIEIMLGGPASIGSDFLEVAENDLITGESIGVAIALVILLLVFRAAGSAWIPIVMAVASIIIAIGTVAVIGQFYKFSFFVTNLITMIGLAVGIDYSLFIVARFREERARGFEKVDAIARAGATATRAVVFSGVTVIFALLGMVIVPSSVFFSIGLGAVLVTIIAVAAAVTALPAILSVIGDGVNGWKLPFVPTAEATHENGNGGFWNTVTNLVMGHPWPALFVGGGLLVAATIPYFSINVGASGIETLPESFSSRQAFEVLQEEFPSMIGGVSAADIVIDGDLTSPDVMAGVERLQHSLEGHEIFGASSFETSESGDLDHLKVVMPVSGTSEAATDAIAELRAQYIPSANIPAEVYVGGQAALNRDFFDLAATWTPIVITLVLALSFVFLMVVFRSIILPVKAIILNLLSVGAAYGLLVLVFQEGFATELLGLQQVATIEAWLPVFLFSILFGLSMDYEVFLLSRIRERYDRTHENRESVAFGLRSTGGIITGAALIMVAVFGGFALGDLVMMQQMGFGLGIAILIDATIIRSILVPATMRLLGDSNWYFPSWLEWLPDLRVDGESEEPDEAPAQPETTVPTPAPLATAEVGGD